MRSFLLRSCAPANATRAVLPAERTGISPRAVEAAKRGGKHAMGRIETYQQQVEALDERERRRKYRAYRRNVRVKSRAERKAKLSPGAAA